MLGQIFQFREENKEVEIYIDGKHVSRFEMLALALNAEDEKRAWMILNWASRLYHHRDDYVFNELYFTVASSVALKYKKDEYTYQHLFKEKCEECGYGKIISYKNDGKNIPDAWVEKDGEFIPFSAFEHI